MKKYMFGLLASLVVIGLFSVSPVVLATEPDDTVYEQIFGPDNRITVTDTKKNFFPSIVKIESTTYNGNLGTYQTWGTGTMVSSDVVITSAHVVYSKESQTYNSNFKITPATSNGVSPYGSSGAIQVVVNPNYISNPSAETDYAVIKLNTPLGDSTGYLKLSTNIGAGDYAQTAGYPEDRVGSMVYASGNIENILENELQYKIDTRGGQSGSPILNAAGEVVGIHSGYNPNITNHAVKISQSVVDLINSVNPAAGQLKLSTVVTTESQPVYRVYNPFVKRHHYTSSINERDTLVNQQGWIDEGVAWKTGDVAPVYRLYNGQTKDHLLTTSMNEVQQLQRAGWINEGVVFQSGTGLDVFRLYSGVTKEHFYTASTTERDNLVNVGWIYEGVAFKAN